MAEAAIEARFFNHDPFYHSLFHPSGYERYFRLIVSLLVFLLVLVRMRFNSRTNLEHGTLILFPNFPGRVLLFPLLFQ